MPNVFIWMVALLASISGFSQQANTSSFFTALNQQIDNYVVQANVTALDTLYADDFVFSHGTGLIDGKEHWLASVEKGNFISRTHDSTTVELHPDLAIVRGHLFIRKKATDKEIRYNLKYVRLFAPRNNRWQLISHITTFEQDE